MKNEELLSLLGKLVSFNSISGSEKPLVDFLDSYLSRYNIETERLDSGTLCALIKGDEGGPTIVLDAHIDTVGIADITKWHTDPFSLTRSNNKLYGRGTSDMKGGAVALISAALSLLNRPFKGKVVLAFVVEEERFEGIASREVSQKYNPDYVIIAESTAGRLNIGQRGRCEIKLEAYGKSCHSSNPDEGENAIFNAFDAISAIKEMKSPTHPKLGKGICVLTDIISSPYPGSSVLPEKCIATFDRRTLVGESEESVIDPINKELEEKGINAKAYIAQGETKSYTNLVLSARRFFPSWLLDENEEIVKKAIRGLKSVGLFTELGCYSFCTNGSHYCGEKGIPTIGYGPGEEKNAHIVDEYIEEESLYKSAEGMRAILFSLLDIV